MIPVFRSYLLTGLRNLLRNKIFTLVNIAGLATGIAAILLIMLYIRFEFSFDQFHKNKNRIYRVLVKEDKDNRSTTSAIYVAAAGPSMQEELPEVQSIVRFSNPTTTYFTYKDVNLFVPGVTFADSTLFNVFSFRLIAGNPGSALTEPFTIVLTRSLADKFFEGINPMGQVIRLNGKDLFKITGVVEDPPANSQLSFQALISFTTLERDPRVFLDWNGGHNYLTYALLHENVGLDNLAARLPAFMEKHINYLYRPLGFELQLVLEPMTKAHLHSIADYDLETRGDLNRIFIFSAIAIFIMVIACINFINLATAQSVYRAREIGMRQVSGASKRDIVIQFIGESMLMTLAAFLAALVIVHFVLPGFNDMTSADLSLFDPGNLSLVPAFILLILVTGIIAGSYPAFYMSRFQPVHAIKGTLHSARGNSIVRNFLVVFQFFISALLIICTLVIGQQIRFLREKPIGFEHQDVVLVSLLSEDARVKYRLLESEFSTIPGVIVSGACSQAPGRGMTMNGYLPAGLEDPIMIHVMDMDEDFLQVIGIPMVRGSIFSRESEHDNSAYIINETLAKTLGWDDPVGQVIYRNGPHKVIGVVRDFHFSTFHEPIKPLIITNEPWSGFDCLAVKTNGQDLSRILTAMETTWSEIAPGEPFMYEMLDDYLREGYLTDRQFGKAMSGFSLLAIFIACLGLLGLASFAAARRKREIGIRKVFGGTMGRIMMGIAIEFAKYVLLANILAWPLAWLAMDRWLQNYAYRTGISLWVFVITGLITLAVTWLTMAWQSVRLARTNPVEVLKHE